MMPPNLRSVVAQGWRSFGTRRNFCSSPVSNGETQSFYEGLKSSYKNPDAKESIEFKVKLANRCTGVLTGFFLAVVTIRKPSWKMARDLEREKKTLGRMLTPEEKRKFERQLL